MSEEGVTQQQNLSLALQALKPKYRKALLKKCDAQKINRLCDSILDTFKEIPISYVKESQFSLMKLHCYFSTNIA